MHGSDARFPEEAFISPDEPIRRREPGSGVPSGSGASEVARMLEELASSLRKQGGVALFAEPRLSPFESMLRGFIAGYLVGGREFG